MRTEQEQLVTGARPTGGTERGQVVRVAVDAMGGDQAPHDIVLGAVQAVAADPLLEVRLVGKADDVQMEMAGALRDSGADVRNRISPVIADQVVEMDDHAAASVRRKHDASIRVAARLVEDGGADALVSARNNSG